MPAGEIRTANRLLNRTITTQVSLPSSLSLIVVRARPRRQRPRQSRSGREGGWAMRCWIWRATALTPYRGQASSRVLYNKVCLSVDGNA